jgi:hypothetical protein
VDGITIVIYFIQYCTFNNAREITNVQIELLNTKAKHSSQGIADNVKCMFVGNPVRKSSV